MTEADTRVEKVVTDMIKKAFPSDLIVGEEDQAESPQGEHGEDFPSGSIWCVGRLIPISEEQYDMIIVDFLTLCSIITRSN